MCRQGCTLPNGTLVNHGYEYHNSEDPCVIHHCANSHLKTLTTFCRTPSNCLNDVHATKPGECCPSCIEKTANFCEEDCDIACQYGYVRNEVQDCDECSCIRKKQTTTSSSTTSTETTSIIKDVLDEGRVTKSAENKFYFYFDKNMLIFISIVLSVALVACMIGITIFFHKKVYKRIVLVSDA